MRFERLHNDSDEVDQLLGFLVDKADEILGERVSAIYVTGSLAYGDFIPQKSDIDGFLFFDGPIESEDSDGFRRLIFTVERNYPAYEGRILDGAVSSQDLEDKRRLEEVLGHVNLTSLVQSGKLIYGRDIFMSVKPPTRWELDTYMAHDVAGILSKRPDRIPCVLEDGAESLRTYSADPQSLIDWLIYPARVLYTMKTGRIGSKRTAVVHYRLSNDDKYNVWLDQAIQMRSQAVQSIPEEQVAPLMEMTVGFFWHLVNLIQTKMGLVRKGEEEVYAPAEAVNRFRRLLDVA
jgi:hypothetical protein